MPPGHCLLGKRCNKLTPSRAGAEANIWCQSKQSVLLSKMSGRGMELTRTIVLALAAEHQVGAPYLV